MMRSLIPQAEDQAAELGHDICWDTIGDTVAHGHCSRCGTLLIVAQSREGIGEDHGHALELPCPGPPLRPPAVRKIPAKGP